MFFFLFIIFGIALRDTIPGCAPERIVFATAYSSATTFLHRPPSAHRLLLQRRTNHVRQRTIRQSFFFEQLEMQQREEQEKSTISIKTNKDNADYSESNDIITSTARTEGITSMTTTSDGGNNMYIGTKRGNVIPLNTTINPSGGATDDCSMVTKMMEIQILDPIVQKEEQGHDGEDDGKRKDHRIKLKPYPIFSLATMVEERQEQNRRRTSSTTIACGGGDRYVTIWEKQSSPSFINSKHIENETLREEESWIITSRLGPHTGWVKDVFLYSFTNSLDGDAADDDNGQVEKEEQKNKEKKENDDNDNKQRKSVILFSIGCNRVEIWQRNENMRNNMKVPATTSGISTTACLSKNDNIDLKDWFHLNTLVIESCPDVGTVSSTLSSDLLCLCFYQVTTPTSNNTMLTKNENGNEDQQHERNSVLLAGGVDGRIHCWEWCPSSSSSLHSLSSSSSPVDTKKKNCFHQSPSRVTSFAAHQGRVNQLLLAKKANLLFSIGHDGFVHCRDLNAQEDKCLERFISWDSNVIQNANHQQQQQQQREATTRLLAMCIVEDNVLGLGATLAVGTSSGKVHILQVKRTAENKDVPIFPSSFSEKLSVQLDENCIIHAIQCVRHKHDDGHLTTATEANDATLVIGHSNGLSSLSLNYL